VGILPALSLPEDPVPDMTTRADDRRKTPPRRIAAKKKTDLKNTGNRAFVKAPKSLARTARQAAPRVP
jgi:hypothetical protein